MRVTIAGPAGTDSPLRRTRSRQAKSLVPLLGALCLALVGLAVLPAFAGAAEALWTRQSPAGSPSARGDAAMAYDGATGQMILFSGVGASGDTWEWNGTDWVQLSPAASPPARNRAVIAYDGATEQLILFGGMGSGNALLNDTWEWNGTNWVQLSPLDSPPALRAATMEYDAATEQLILFGGEGGEGDETWEWSGADWTRLHPATAPPERSRASMAYDDATGQLILFGGFSPAGPELSDTWNWDGTNWTELHPSTHPPELASAPTAYVPIISKILIQGGLQEGNPISESWTWDGSDWALETPAVVPSPRGETSMVYDPAVEETVLFGGEGSTGALGDTWTYQSAPAPTAAITSPADGQTFSQGQRVATAFECADTGGAGIGSCVDSGGASGGTGTLDTSTLGPHTYTVTAVSVGGLRGEASISYTVAAPPAEEPTRRSSPPPSTPPALGGYFGLKSVRRDLAAGSARIAVKFTGAGEVELTGAGVEPFTRQVSTGTTSLPIIPTAALRAKLARAGNARVTVTVSFKTPGNVWRRKKRGVVLRLKPAA